jgi:hypothetical protein
MVLLWMAIELIAWIPLDIYFLNYLENQAIQQARQSLVQQIQQLAHFGPAAPLALKTIKIQLPFEFQSLSARGVVLWDSIDPDRHQKVIEQPHFLLNHALKNMTQQDQIEYADQLGAFKRNEDGQLFLGSVSKKNILSHKGHWIEQVMLLNLMLICLTGILGIILLKSKKLAQLNALSDPRPSLNHEPSNSAFTGLISLNSEDVQPSLPFPVPLKKDPEPNRPKRSEQLHQNISARHYEVQSYHQTGTQHQQADFWGSFEVSGWVALYVCEIKSLTQQDHTTIETRIQEIRSCFATIQHQYQIEPKRKPLPSMWIEASQHWMNDHYSKDYSLTTFFVLFETNSQKLQYSSAGHHPAWIFRHGKPMETLHSLGRKADDINGLIRYEDDESQLEKDAVLVLYTSGFWNSHSKSNLESYSPFGKLIAKVQFSKLVEQNPILKLSNIRQQVIESLHEHSGKNPFETDRCFILLRGLS